jgi:hypothetical protein
MEGAADERMTTTQYFARHALFGVIAFGLLLPAVFGDPERAGSGSCSRTARCSTSAWSATASTCGT